MRYPVGVRSCGKVVKKAAPVVACCRGNSSIIGHHQIPSLTETEFSNT